MPKWTRAQARYDANYRISANFLNWVIQNHDKDLIQHLNASARAGKYNESNWQERTGYTVQALSAKWLEHLAMVLRP